MDQDQMRNLFSSLSILAQQGGHIPVQAYSMLMSNNAPEVLAEQLHQRWLADETFTHIAADIVLHIHKADKKEMALSSCILAFLLNDYRSRLEIRNRSHLMYRNSVKAIYAMYPVYLHIDECVSRCFVKPMFNSLTMLIDNPDPDSEDIETMAILLTQYGKQLFDLNSFRVDQLIVKIRIKLCTPDMSLSQDVRRILLHVLDLWCFGWNELMIPEILLLSSADNTDGAENIQHRKNDIDRKDFGSKESIV